MAEVALITGGSQGIGYVMAEAFGKAGYSLAICSRTDKDVKNAGAKLRASGFECIEFALDVSDTQVVAEKVAAVATQLGRIDVLVNCAGVYGPIGPLEENDEMEWESAIMINLCGTAYCTRAVIPIMKAQRKGSIINMAGAGVGGDIKPNFSSYVTSKFAVCGFTEAVSRELEGTGVRINAISPGAINTRLLDQVLKSGEKAGRFYQESLKQKESGGTDPRLAAEFAVFLSSKEASHINGKTLSAVWDTREKLASPGKSLYTLRRIDNELFAEKMVS